jgi:hypothetical protein
MPTMNTDPATSFASGENRTDLFAGLGGGLVGAQGLWSGEEVLVGGLFLLFGLWLVVRGIRIWGKPYAELGNGRLVLFDHGRLKHYVPLTVIVGIDKAFNGIRLKLRDGLAIRVGHLGFVSSEEAKRFRAELALRLDRPVAGAASED